MNHSADDQPFRHYTTKHKIISWVSRNLFDNVTYTVRHGLLTGMKRKGGLGWVPRGLAGGASTAEEAFWLSQNFHGMVVYDIGAFQGLLTMFFARGAKQVIAYEPNTANHARLTENLRLNGIQNVMVRKLGVGSKAETATMVGSPMMAGGASIDSSMVDGIQKSNLPIVTEQITVVRLDDDIRTNALPAPDFVKIDIEGFELAALTGARETLAQYKPKLFLEMHGETMNLKKKAVAGIVAFLVDVGYNNIQHVESGTLITNANSAVAAEGHLYCS